MIDAHSPEADELLARHEREAAEVARIRLVREREKLRQRSAHQMAHELAQLGMSFDGSGSEYTYGELGALGDLLEEHELTPSQRADVWAYVSQMDERLGW